MEIPEKCIGCPNLELYQSVTMGAEGDKMLLRELSHQVMDADDRLAELVEQDEYAEVLLLNSQIEKQACGIERQFSSKDGLIKFCELQAGDLAYMCSKGIRSQRRFRLFGSYVVKCGSKSWGKSATAQLKSYHNSVRKGR